MTCNAVIVTGVDGWQVWCRGCGWEHDTVSLPHAQVLKREHNNKEGNTGDR